MIGLLFIYSIDILENFLIFGILNQSYNEISVRNINDQYRTDQWEGSSIF